MRKVYAVAGFLSEENKENMRSACEDLGYEISFYDSVYEADGLVSDGEIIYCSNPGLLKQMPELRWCGCSNAGVDAFIRTGVFDSGEVILTNCSGAYGLTISEHIVMVTLMLMRRMPEYLAAAGRREWIHNLKIRSVSGSVIAIAGTGNLGQTAAEKFRGMGAAEIRGFNRSGRAAKGFDRTFGISDIYDNVGDVDVLVLCLPGTPETEEILSAELISRLPETAYVVNVGRGTAVDQDALTEALNEGRLAGAALDVVVPEPLPAGHPLWNARNCIITPHSSGDMGLSYTVDTTVDMFCANLRRFSLGEELINRIDPERGY